MDWKKVVAFGCGGCLLVGVIAAVVMVGCLSYLGKDPEGVEVVVPGPIEVEVGETFQLEVQVTNRRSSGSLTVTSLDLDEGYLAGFAVLSTTPGHSASTHIPLDDTRSFTFDRAVAAGETATFTFELRAVQAGNYRGDVDVCEGPRFLSKMLQTSVR